MHKFNGAFCCKPLYFDFSFLPFSRACLFTYFSLKDRLLCWTWTIGMVCSSFLQVVLMILVTFHIWMETPSYRSLFSFLKLALFVEGMPFLGELFHRLVVIEHSNETWGYFIWLVLFVLDFDIKSGPDFLVIAWKWMVDLSFWFNFLLLQ